MAACPPKWNSWTRPKGSVHPSCVSPVPPMVHSRVGRVVQSRGTSKNPNNLPRRPLHSGFIVDICTSVSIVLGRTGVDTRHRGVHLHLCCREIGTSFFELQINSSTLPSREEQVHSREEPQGKKQAPHFWGSGISSKTASSIKKHRLNACKGHGKLQTPAITFQRNFDIWESKAILAGKDVDPLFYC